MAPGTDRYRESRVERQGEGGGGEEKQQPSQENKKERGREVVGWGGVGARKEVGECGCCRVEVSQGEKNRGESEMECVEGRGREEDK